MQSFNRTGLEHASLVRRGGCKGEGSILNPYAARNTGIFSSMVHEVLKVLEKVEENSKVYNFCLNTRKWRHWFGLCCMQHIYMGVADRKEKP